jgi:hypothetical protein
MNNNTKKRLGRSISNSFDDSFDKFEDEFGDEFGDDISSENSAKEEEKRLVGGENSAPSKGHKTYRPARVAAVLFTVVALAIGAIFLHSYLKNFVEIDGERYDLRAGELDLSGNGLSDWNNLADFKNLTRLDVTDILLSGSDFEYISSIVPGCDIVWSVPVGENSFDSDAESISIDNLTEETAANLSYFTKLSRADVENCADYELLMGIVESMPDTEFSWKVEILGQTYDSSAAEIDFTGKKVDSFDDFREKLSYMPKLTKVVLFSSGLSNEQIDKLIEDKPDCTFEWDFTMFGINVKTTDETVDMKEHKVTDLTLLRKNLGYLKNLKKIDMCRCGLSNTQMEALTKEFPNTKFVWIVRMAYWYLKTDETGFSTKQYRKGADPDAYRLHSGDIEVLKYCTDLEALDLGHNMITDISVIGTLTKLKVLIIADNQITDIKPLANLKDLYYLEVFSNFVKDLSPLKGLNNLLDLNFSGTRVSNIDVLLTLPKLERVLFCETYVTGASIKKLKKAHPNCQFDYTGKDYVGFGWRNHDRYDQVLKALKPKNPVK